MRISAYVAPLLRAVSSAMLARVSLSASGGMNNLIELDDVKDADVDACALPVFALLKMSNPAAAPTCPIKSRRCMRETNKKIKVQKNPQREKIFSYQTHYSVICSLRNYSYRRASIGLRFAALRAGYQ